MMEMLAYSRPGVIEVLPALPPALVKGSINGMLARTFARIDKLAWDMEARTVDVTITSVRKQDITLIAPAWNRRDLRTRRSVGSGAPAGHGQLRPALAGEKAGGITSEDWTTRTAGMG